MDGLSAAASVIAVIDISAKVATLCFQYSAAVKDAKEDIERLKQKVKDIGDVLRDVQRLLDRQDKTRLSATHKLKDSLNECLRRLQELEIQLRPEKTPKAMSRFGGRALQWPFKSKEIDKIIACLNNLEQTFSLSLQVDQTCLILDLDQKFDLAGADLQTRRSDLSTNSLVVERDIVGSSKSIDIPFGVNRNFLGRSTVLESLDAALTSGNPVVALHGAAGVGKTQCAVEYCWSRQRRYSGGVFWLDATSTESLDISLREILDRAATFNRDELRRNFIDWATSKKDFLLVLDNLERETEFLTLIGHAVSVNILVTTRDSALAGSYPILSGLEIDLFDAHTSMTLFLLNLGPWDTHERTRILSLMEHQDLNTMDFDSIVNEKIRSNLSRLPQKFGIENAAQLREIASLTGYLPLAIVQSASYLREYPMPFASYVQKFNTMEPHARQKFHSHPTPGAVYQGTVMTTWDITLEKLQQDNPTACSVLTLLGFLDRSHTYDNFCHSLGDVVAFWGVSGQLTKPTQLQYYFQAILQKDSGQMDEALGRLVSLSLAKRNHDRQTITLHPLVHDWIHLRLDRCFCAEYIQHLAALLWHHLPPLMYATGDKDCPRRAESVFGHLERVYHMMKMYIVNGQGFRAIRQRSSSLPPNHGSLLLFIEAYLWFYGEKYLTFAETLMKQMSLEQIGGNANRRICGVVYGSKLIQMLIAYQSSSDGIIHKDYGLYWERLRKTEENAADPLANINRMPHEGYQEYGYGLSGYWQRPRTTVENAADPLANINRMPHEGYQEYGYGLSGYWQRPWTTVENAAEPTVKTNERLALTQASIYHRLMEHLKDYPASRNIERGDMYQQTNHLQGARPLRYNSSESAGSATSVSNDFNIPLAPCEPEKSAPDFPVQVLGNGNTLIDQVCKAVIAQFKASELIRQGDRRNFGSLINLDCYTTATALMSRYQDGGKRGFEMDIQELASYFTLWLEAQHKSWERGCLTDQGQSVGDYIELLQLVMDIGDLNALRENQKRLEAFSSDCELNPKTRPSIESLVKLGIIETNYIGRSILGMGRFADTFL